MSEEGAVYRIFISAAEPSGDAHCADLINALKQSDSRIEFVGAGGDKMAAAGCELLERTVDRAAMTYKAFRHAPHFFRLIMRISHFFRKNKIDLVIVCDSPAFNFHIAKAAKKARIKTLFYVAPQLWAWGAWRIKKLAKYCERLACILPFEQDWFGQKGIDTTFVGNPMLDEFEKDLSANKKDYKDYVSAKAVIALMPGSRAAEIERLWPAMQRVAVGIKRKHPNVTLTAVAVDEKGKEILKSMQILGFRCQYIIGSVTEAAGSADFSIVASGSATLQVAACGCPMVIMYQSSRILWHLLGRWLVKTRYLSLVNILADRELVPEFMPYFSSIEPIGRTVEQLLAEKDKLAETSSQLVELAEPLRRASAAGNTAKIALDMLGSG